MLVPFKDFGYTIKIAQYTVKQEKELLFLETYYPEFNDDILDAAFDILNVSPEIYTKLTHDEKVASICDRIIHIKDGVVDNEVWWGFIWK